MGLTKYASLEGTKVLEVKSSPQRVRTASLDKMADFNDYRTDDGYLYVRIRAISSRVNKNNDGWPTAELAGGSEVWEKISSQHTSSEGGFTVEASKDAEYGFPTFLGKPNFVDHHNSDPKRARGVVVDSKFRVLDSKTAAESDDYWGGRAGHIDPEHLPAAEVELLIEVDAKSFPKYAKAIVDGDIDGFSMGCDVDYSKCSHCGHTASNPDEYCSHIIMKGADMRVESGDHKGKTAKTYENCYGIKFFEISGVFDPADETALAKEVVAAVEKEADDLLGAPTPYHKPDPEEVMQRARVLTVDNPGMPLADAMQMAAHELSQQWDRGVSGGDGAHAPIHLGPGDYTPVPKELPIGEVGVTKRYEGSYLASVRKQALQPDEPQSFHTKAPEDVNTLREEKICPQCGSDMDDVKCAVCGFEEPPESLQNPDLDAAKLQGDAADGLVDSDPLAEDQAANPNAETYLKTRNPQPTASVTNEMRWRPKGIPAEKLAAEKPQGDEPIETVTSDQDQPVTSAFRTAQQLIAAAAKRNQENTNMSDQTRVAADPADASGKPDKRVDVEGVGGVIQDSNEEASKPRGPHSWESEGTTVDVEGKGGVLQDSNAEASKPSDGKQDVAKAVKTDDSGPTKTWDNSNEPDSAVTDKAVQAAKKGTDPADPVGKADKRIDVEEPPHDRVGPGTDQWTGTDGNGVTKQQPPVTRKVDPNIEQPRKSSLISLAALKLADAEVELGVLAPSKKYDRLAELAEMEEAEVVAEHRALARVRTAGLTRTASNGGVSRMPSFGKIARDTEPEAPKVDDSQLDSALFN